MSVYTRFPCMRNGVESLLIPFLLSYPHLPTVSKFFLQFPYFFQYYWKELHWKIGNTDNFLFLASKRIQLVPPYSCTYLICKTGNSVYIFHCLVKSSESTTIIFSASSSPLVFLDVRWAYSYYPFLEILPTHAYWTLIQT